MAEHRYKLQYKIDRKPDGFTKEDAIALQKDGVGSCDAMLLASIIYPEDGSLSVLFIGQDGRTDQELEDHEWFKVWMMLTSRLANSRTLDPGRRQFCAEVFEDICRSMKGPDDGD